MKNEFSVTKEISSKIVLKMLKYPSYPTEESSEL